MISILRHTPEALSRAAEVLRHTPTVARRAIASCSVAAVLTSAAVPASAAASDSIPLQRTGSAAGGQTASTSTAPFSMRDIGPAPATGFRISDIGPIPPSGHDTGRTPERPQEAYTISDIGSRWRSAG